mgnify:CR=1 FL=1
MEKRNYITPDIIEVKALEDYLIYIKYETNEEKVYDMKNLINKIDFYKKLKDKEYFKKVIARGETVEWPDGQDVAPENLYYDSVEFKHE